MLANDLWFSWWTEADWIVRGVFLILLGLSVLSWSVILGRLWLFARTAHRERRARSALDAAMTLEAALESLPPGSPSRLLASIAAHQRRAAPNRDGLREHLEQGLAEQRLGLESELTLLASIGSAAPFIGLLGTVWGIMHALGALDSDQGLSIETVAGPVGEALVATAAGLFTAIPAVMAYNLLVRRLRRLNTLLSGNTLCILDLATRAAASAATPSARVRSLGGS
jgi:biopolymer transport protein ExbB